MKALLLTTALLALLLPGLARAQWYPHYDLQEDQRQQQRFEELQRWHEAQQQQYNELRQQQQMQELLDGQRRLERQNDWR